MPLSITNVYLLHPDAAIAAYFAKILSQRCPDVHCLEPPLPFDAENISETGIDRFTRELNLPQGALLVGFRLGGLVAAKIQEQRPDLHVFAISAPITARDVTLAGKLPQRFALNTTGDAGGPSASGWPRFAEAYNVRWVYVRHMVAALLAAYIAGTEVQIEVERNNKKHSEGARPSTAIETVYLLHGKGGSPTGSVSKLEAVLSRHWPAVHFNRPLMPHNDPNVPAERSVEFLHGLNIPQSALVIGISLGGLVAAAYQEQARHDLQVICINSPTWADAVHLSRWMDDRVSIYSSRDEVIAGRTAEWPQLAEAYDFPWLTHDTDPHLKYLIRLIDWYIEGRLGISADRVLDVPRTRQEAADEGRPK